MEIGPRLNIADKGDCKRPTAMAKEQSLKGDIN